MNNLRKLARHIFDLTCHQVWIGGKTKSRGESKPNWPPNLEKIDWSADVTWTLSPEIEIGAIRLRVCVSWDGNRGEFYGDHQVRVFADDELKYPGGRYEAANRLGILWEHRDAWSWKIASTERQDGGRTGRVAGRNFLLQEAQNRLKNTQTKQSNLICPVCDAHLIDPRNPYRPGPLKKD